MLDRMQSGRGPRSSRWRLIPAERRGAAIIVAIIIIAGILIGGHFYGRYLASIDLAEREAQLEQLRAESQKQKRDIDSKSQQLTTLQDKLK